MAARGRLGSVVETATANALIGWIVVAFVGLVVPVSFVSGDFLWSGFAASLVALAVVPPVAFRNPTVMLPWEVLVIAAVPLIGRTFATVPLTSRFATYVAVAAIALVIAVELHVFTPVRMTPGFAVVFVVIATMATAGTWAVVRWVVDVTLGTSFLLDPALSHEAIETQLMWEFVYSTAAGVVAGLVFEGYFRRRARARERLSRDMEVEP